MKTNRIIISSLSLYNYLKECLGNAHPESENPIIINCDGSSIYISNLSKRGISCEANKMEWAFEFDYVRLDRFCKVLKHLSEQPITLTFDDGYLTISYAVI